MRLEACRIRSHATLIGTMKGGACRIDTAPSGAWLNGIGGLRIMKNASAENVTSANLTSSWLVEIGIRYVVAASTCYINANGVDGMRMKTVAITQSTHLCATAFPEC